MTLHVCVSVCVLILDMLFLSLTRDATHCRKDKGSPHNRPIKAKMMINGAVTHKRGSSPCSSPVRRGSTGSAKNDKGTGQHSTVFALLVLPCFE